MVFQEPMTCLNPTMTVGGQSLEVIIRNKKISKINAKKDVIGLLELVEIPDPIQRSIEYTHQLSGGMRQRIMIAIALACDPKLIIADEPTSALDVTIQNQIINLLNKLQKQLQLSYIFISHDMTVIKAISDRIIVLKDGLIVEENISSNLFNTPKSEYTKKLISSVV